MFLRLSARRLIVLDFAGLILVGTALLNIPVTNNSVSWIDAFFESVSTATGLQVVPADAFTPFGQAIQAVLVQLGGLGIMTATTVGALLIGRRMGLRDLLIVREELASPDSPRNVARLLGQVAFITFLVELMGVVALTVRFALGFPVLANLYYWRQQPFLGVSTMLTSTLGIWMNTGSGTFVIASRDA